MPTILCPVSEVNAGGKEVIAEIEGKRCYLMLFQHDGDILAYHNVCPHQGRNLNFAPDRFLFDPNGRLVCPHHGALFDVDSGHCVQGPCQGAALRRIAVKTEAGDVMLEDGNRLPA